MPTRRQRQLPLDPALLQRPERHGPRRLRDGELGRRCPRLRAGDPQELIETRRGGCDDRHRLEFLLHRHAALHAVVPRQGQSGTHRAQGQGAVHRRPPHLPPDRPRAPRLHRRSRSSSSPTSCGSTGAKQPETTPAATTCWPSDFPKRHVRRCAGLCKVATLTEIEAQGWSLNPAATWAWPTAPGRRLRLRRAAGGAERGTGSAQRRGAGAGGADRGERGEVTRTRLTERRPSYAPDS